MQAFIFIFSFLVFGLGLAVIEFYLYYTYGGKRVLVFILGGALFLILLAIAGMAGYESFKHRHDKEPW